MDGCLSFSCAFTSVLELIVQKLSIITQGICNLGMCHGDFDMASRSNIFKSYLNEGNFYL